MFDAEASSATDAPVNMMTDQTQKKQYTLKGVEEETIALMRSAASKEGMKIGSWVSKRIKEAAEKALLSDEGRDRQSRAPIKPDDPSELVSQLCLVINAQREEAEARFSRLEAELRDLAKGQHAIMTSLLTIRQ